MQNNIDIGNLKVDAFTTPAPVVVKGEESIADIINKMEANGFRHLPFNARQPYQ